jgi:hypothetical protein
MCQSLQAMCGRVQTHGSISDHSCRLPNEAGNFFWMNFLNNLKVAGLCGEQRFTSFVA